MRHRISLILFLTVFLTPGWQSLHATPPAATWEDNPTGNTGALKAQIETGGSYDPHSGNGTRVVNDLRVHGALGTYGLDFTRYWNSTHSDVDEPTNDWPLDFGMSSWSHSWRWTAVERHEGPWPVNNSDFDDGRYITSITITFPDGHTTKFKIERCGPHSTRVCDYYNGSHGPPYIPLEVNAAYMWPYGGPGVHDHICDMALDGSNFWLCRADGGSVHFTGGPGEYQAKEVYDSNGFLTTLKYNPTTRQLERVEQDGGRALVLTWGSIGDAAPVIKRVDVEGTGGSQYVTYTYIDLDGFLVLSRVTYPNEPRPGETATAVYTYGFCFGSGNPCSGPSSEFPMLKRADDPHYAGPMTIIQYEYMGQGCPVPAIDPQWVLEYVPSQPYAIAAEKSERGRMVSSFEINCESGERWETNGLGGKRKLYFGRAAHTTQSLATRGFNLAKLTDFTADWSSLAASHSAENQPCPVDVPCHRQTFDSKCLPAQIWDGRNNWVEQSASVEDDSGQPDRVKYPAGGNYPIETNSTFDRVHVIGTPTNQLDGDRMHNKYNHWLFQKKDQNGNYTSYTRDARRRVTQIDYHQDGSFEKYSYNGLNQIETHTLPNGTVEQPGNVEHYDYDSTSHLLVGEWNSWDKGISDLDFKEYTYYGPGNHPEWTGLVDTMTDGRARVNRTFSTKMEYNGRGLVTKVTYPSTDSSPDPFITYEYDQYGNCTAIIDELGHRKDYTYDSYRRCTSLIEQLNAPGWDGSGTVTVRQWTWVYDRVIEVNGAVGPTISASAHTSKEWRIQVEPIFNEECERRVTARTFDVNNRIKSEQTGLIQPCNQPLGAWHAGSDTEIHRFSYDENGQKQTYTDPRLRITRYEYDSRNRLWKTTEPLDRITETFYDAVGNKTLLKFPENNSVIATQEWLDYDAFGQPGRFIDERRNTTHMEYWHWGPMKKLAVVTTHRTTDATPQLVVEDQRTRFYYDGMGRPQNTFFPDNTSEGMGYMSGQLEIWRTRKNQVKTISYDARGRENANSWSLVPGVNPPTPWAPGINRVWDAASRLTSISNIFSTIGFEYDDASQVRWERDNVSGAYGMAQTNYWRYPSGEVARIQYPSGTLIRRNYTARGQLKYVGWGSGDTSYVYLEDGKVDHQARSNHVTTSYGYNGRGMIGSVRHRNNDADNGVGHDLAFRDYSRDKRDRIVAWKRGTDSFFNQMEDGRGDRYHYDEEGQLDAASYRASNPETNNPGPAMRTDTFQYDELGNRKGMNHVASRGADMTIKRRDNGLNQYDSWWNDIPPGNLGHWGTGVFYDDNVTEPAPDPNNPNPPPWPWVYPGNGVMMQDGYITGGFNALNQPVQIWSFAYLWTSNWMWFGYDPLGRCVKRWIGPSGDPATAAATYYYYEGWNLIQEGPNALSADRLYVHGGRVDEIVASHVNGSWLHHHYDAQGNCILQSNAAGAVQVQYEYDAFGFPYVRNAAGAKAVPQTRFLFTGREWLADLRLYDYRNRMYQPELGRFLQPDSTGFAAGDYNLYRYCHNDPINKTDPTGLVGFDDGDISADKGFPGMLQLQRLVIALVGGASFKCIQDMGAGKTHDFAVAQGKQAAEYYKNTNAGEAVRHITWVAEGARQYDEKQAMAVADAHEFEAANQEDSSRDSFNNLLGPEIGSVSDGPNDSAFMAKMAWESGEAAQSEDDPRLPRNKDE